MGLNRGIDAPVLAALASGNFHPIFLAHVDWPGDPLWASTALEPVTWDERNWLPIKDLGVLSIGGEEFGGAVPSEASLGIRGPIATLEALLEEVAIRNRDVDIYFALVTTPQGGTLVGEPVPCMIGYADGNEFGLRTNGKGVSARFALSVLSGPSIRTVMSSQHSLEDHQDRFPDDTGFRHTQLIELSIANPPQWG